jgi:CheY-like chemotaxis protein
MRSVLVPAGYEVMSAADRPTALQMAQASQPHLILLDLSMPDMDGYAVSDVITLAPELLRPVPEFSSAISTDHVLILLDIEELLASTEMGLVVETVQ